MAIPLEAIVKLANVRDSSIFNYIINNMDIDMVHNSIIILDLGYYGLDRFIDLNNRNIRFVSRIKNNVKNVVIKELTNKNNEFKDGKV
ncbi:transposase [Ferroplasma sp.]|uniref:transposase n=1 Tax=Ferroplasma sp. TaxID=2591003 RepID=UPI00261C5FB1|nr:transposase [Ferroplasma sp.]